MGVYDAVHDLFSQNAKQFNNSIAIDNGKRRVTYGELGNAVEALTTALMARGVTSGSIVGVFLTDTIEIITAILAILKARGVFCPLDPAFPEKRLQVMFESVSPAWCVTQSEFGEQLQRITSAADRVLIDAVTANGATTQLTRETLESDPDAPCSVYFTSGSTGKPKAILGRLKGIDHYVRWEIEAVGVKAGTRVSQLASPSFDGFLKDAFVPLCAGGVVCAPENREHRSRWTTPCRLARHRADRNPALRAVGVSLPAECRPERQIL